MGHDVGHYIQVIRYQGIFDLDGLFKLVYGWLVDKGYEVREKKLKHKVPSPSGIEEEIHWEAFKKETDYIKMWLYIIYHSYDMKEVEVVKDGKKRLLTKARIHVELKSYIELDWQSRWESSVFLKGFRNFYEKYVIKHEIEDVFWDKNYYIIYKLHALIKEHLDLEMKSNAYHDVW